MKKIAIALAAVLMMAFMLVGCGKQAAYSVADGVIQQNGTYTIPATLEGGSGKASIESPVKITVNDKVMTATIVMSSSNYDLMIVDGTEYRPTIAQGKSTFTIPVKKLDVPLAIKAETTAMSEAHMIDYNIVFNLINLKAA